MWLAYVVQLLSCIQVFATSRTVAHQAPLSMEFSRQEYWSGAPSPPPGDLPDPGIELATLASPALEADSLLLSQCGFLWLSKLFYIFTGGSIVEQPQSELCRFTSTWIFFFH